MRVFITTSFLLVLTTIYSFGQSGFYSVNGKSIVHPNGEKIQLKGTNLGNWLVPEGYMFKFEKTNSPGRIQDAMNQLLGPAEAKEFWKGFVQNYIREVDIKFLAQIGCNHLRLPFHYKMFTNEDYLGKDYHGFTELDSVISWCESAGLGVVLDMHCAPAGQTGDNIDDSDGYPFLFLDKQAQSVMKEIWVKLATKYKDNKTVIGYGLMNEPIAHYFEADLEMLNSKLEPLYKELTTSIRAIDKNHLLFYSGAQWNTNFSVFSEPFDDKAVYEFHKYWVPTVQGEIQSFLDYSEKYQVPIYCGETGENTDEWVKNWRKLLDEFEVSWAFWPYKKMDNTKGIMNFNRPDDYQVIIDYVESDRGSYKLVRENRPDFDLSKLILTEYLRLSLFEHAFPNQGYIEALGFKLPESAKSVVQSK
jgi:endoglucanase